MNFRIADTFTASLAKLTGNEQKAVKTTAFDLQLNPAHPGMRFHKLNAARDPNFCSLRVNRDIRLIVHRSAGNLLLCYVDHHDKAYRWAERRKLETHPKTGAAQLVEIREKVREVVVPARILPKEKNEGTQKRPVPHKAALFENVAADELLSFGVPAEWLEDLNRPMKTRCLRSPGASRARPPRRCSNWPAADGRKDRRRSTPWTRSSTRMRSGAFGLWPTRRRLPSPSSIPGSSGRYSCIPRSALSSRKISADRPRFLLEEWQDVVDAWQLHTWEDYRDVRRLARSSMDQ